MAKKISNADSSGMRALSRAMTYPNTAVWAAGELRDIQWGKGLQTACIRSPPAFNHVSPQRNPAILYQRAYTSQSCEMSQMTQGNLVWPQQQAHYWRLLGRRTIASMTAQPRSRRTKWLVMERNFVDGRPVDTSQPTVGDGWEDQQCRHLIRHTIATLILACVALTAGWICLDTFAPAGSAHTAPIAVPGRPPGTSHNHHPPH
jgi:hypothetical protein